MREPVFVGSAFVAQYPQGGGNSWVPMQWLLGLLEQGHDAWWLEYLWTRGDLAVDRAYIDLFWQYVRRYGVGDRVVLGYFPTGSKDEPDGPPEYSGALSEAEFVAKKRDGLLLNMVHSMTPPLREGFGRTALFDLDPGPFQIWASQWDMGVGSHDLYLTIGMNLGAPDSPVPLHGVDWKRVWPAVHLPQWPVQPVLPAGQGAYTTVTQWWNNSWAYLGDEVYDCNKRPGFLPLLPLADRAGVRIELAANVHVNEREDRAALAAHHWTLLDPHAVAGTPEDFRSFVQRSRGEVSAAKPSYVKARSGWISDRTICYLASGRPCVVESTGAEAYLPASAGLRFFRDVDEAVDAVRAIEADYPAASRAARALAERVFATDVTVPALLRAAGA